MRPLATDVAWSVCVCVSSVEPIAMPFGLWTRVGPRNHVLAGGPDLPKEEAVLGVVPPLKYVDCVSIRRRGSSKGL